jgi:hypothetical protein
MASDGSGLVGGLNPGNVGQALRLDVNGNLLVNGAGGGSGGDGAAGANLGEQAIGLYNSGGPPLANGTPGGLAFDRWRSWLGKGSQSNAISATSAGDTQLTFSAAPKTLLPGTAVKLLGGALPEYVYVASSYVPSPTTTVVPLASPVVNAGQNNANWSVFSLAGPGSGAVPVDGIAMVAEVLFDVATGNLYAKQGLRGVQDVSVGGRASLAIAAGVSANTVVKAGPGRLARLLVTASGTGALSVYDNAGAPSGTIIALVPAGAAAGTLIDCQAPAASGLTVAGNSNNPAVTIFYY